MPVFHGQLEYFDHLDQGKSTVNTMMAAFYYDWLVPSPGSQFIPKDSTPTSQSSLMWDKRIVSSKVIITLGYKIRGFVVTLSLAPRRISSFEMLSGSRHPF